MNIRLNRCNASAERGPLVFLNYNHISGNDRGGISNICGPKTYNTIIANKFIGISDHGYYLTYYADRANYNNLYDNVYYDLVGTSNFDGTGYNAKYNYWGTEATAEINAGGNPKNISTIGDYFDGGSSYGMVNYSNWLNSVILLPLLV